MQIRQSGSPSLSALTPNSIKSVGLKWRSLGHLSKCGLGVHTSSLGEEMGAAETDLPGVLAAALTPTSALLSPTLNLAWAGLGPPVAQCGKHFLGQVAWDGPLPATAATQPGDSDINQDDVGQPR